MKILVTGYTGQLGFDVVKQFELDKRNTAMGVGVEHLDITNRQSVLDFIGDFKPNLIVHCAAYTAVDRAEEDKDTCFNVNVNGTINIVEAAKIVDAKLIYISTDYVFDGLKEGEYETNDLPNPISIYGQTKLLGELEVKKYFKHFIIRISWVFGKNGNNFIKTMLRLGKEKEFLNIVSDQVGSPTYTKDLAILINEMAMTNRYGTYHATNENFCSWYDFSLEIFKLAGIDISVNPILTADYPTKALRPKNSRLSKNSLSTNGFNRLPTWQDALSRYLEEIKEI